MSKAFAAKDAVPPLPADLFKPSAGRDPPLLAGRDELLDRMRKTLIEPIMEGDAPVNAFLLHGPRGSGKTCAVNHTADELRRQCGKALILPLQGGDISTTDALAHDLMDPENYGDKAPVKEQISKTFSGGVNISLPGAVGIDLAGSAKRDYSDKVRASRIINVMRALTKDGTPLLLTLDEVHAASGEEAEKTLQVLLNAVQSAMSKGAEIPVGLIMAGTPDALGRIMRINATFAERLIGLVGGDLGNQPLNGIGEEAAKQAIVEPFAKLGRSLPQEALDGVFMETAGYPYFIQLYGHALADAARRQAPNAKEIPAECVEAALAKFAKAKNAFYGERLGEIEDAGVLEAAIKVIGCIRENDGAIDRRKVLKACEEGLDSRDAVEHSPHKSTAEWAKSDVEAMDKILHSGLIWGDGGARSSIFHLAVPSLGKYIEQAAQASPESHIKALANEASAIGGSEANGDLPVG